MSDLELKCDYGAADTMIVTVYPTSIEIELQCLENERGDMWSVFFRDPDKIRALRDACDEALQACSGS